MNQERHLVMNQEMSQEHRMAEAASQGEGATNQVTSQEHQMEEEMNQVGEESRILQQYRPKSQVSRMNPAEMNLVTNQENQTVATTNPEEINQESRTVEGTMSLENRAANHPLLHPLKYQLMEAARRENLIVLASRENR